MKIYTLGHSTRDFEEFLSILKKFEIQLVVDVRRFPSSKKFPWFNKENLEVELAKNNISYIHFSKLGGFREKGYETFSKTKEFKDAVKELLDVIDGKVTAILCAEWNPMRCHRWYISEKLSEMKHEIIHIISLEKYQNHLELPKKKLKIKCDKLKFF
ncbi:MAG: DUF488 domain-containing protein [Candidatus Aenigmatarchaeota archaeon]